MPVIAANFSLISVQITSCVKISYHCDDDLRSDRRLTVTIKYGTVHKASFNVKQSDLIVERSLLLFNRLGK